MHNKENIENKANKGDTGNNRNKRQDGKMHLIGELMGSADQINLDGISEPRKSLKLNNADNDEFEEDDDDDDEITMKKDCDKG